MSMLWPTFPTGYGQDPDSLDELLDATACHIPCPVRIRRTMRSLLGLVFCTSWSALASPDFPEVQLGPVSVEAGGGDRAVSLGEDRPTVSITREGSRVAIGFSGRLQSAPAVTGPWLDLPAARSPYFPESLLDYGFYRSISTEVASIFSARSVVELTLVGPLQQHFDLALAGMPDGIIPPKREKPPFQGTVALNGQELAAGLRVRGYSSLQECPFPKLTLKVGRDVRTNTPFFDAREIKIGTHCAEGGRGPIGRLRDERSTYREALAYEAMEHLGFLCPRIRRARIEFQDTTPTNRVSEVGWTVTRNAMLLDDAEVVGERLGGHALDDDELAALTDARFDPQLIVDLRFLHALLGNWDFVLNETGERLWNTDVIELPNGTLVPLVGDFDLCSFVTEIVRDRAPHDYHPELPELDRQTRHDLEQIRGSTTSDRFLGAAQRFAARREGLLALVNEAEVDDLGRANARNHVEAFFRSLDAVGVRK